MNKKEKNDINNDWLIKLLKTEDEMEKMAKNSKPIKYQLFKLKNKGLTKID